MDTGATKDGIFNVAEQITNGLEQFIEAGYHLRDEALIEERQLLLREPGSIRQSPFIEATPSYLSKRRISDLGVVPAEVRDVLTQIAGFDVGIFDPPYEHQASALERYFSDRDLLIATGTGSGKTESFLSTVISSLVIEAKARPVSSELRGVRALLLYPMNALVNDQVFRIRKLIGDSRVSELLRRGKRLRPVTFGSYTSRTPYHGRRTSAKDRERIGKPIEQFYIRLEREAPRLADELKRTGRWPSKDLDAFFASQFESRDSAGRLRDGHWDQRLKSSFDDSELMTRHEMIVTPPDILVTNYSMLEYMLLRPFERAIFQSTADWLASDGQNEFIVVLDEAHLYRGSSGAEVALLLRRLAARLGIDRERMRFVLTTASIGEGSESDAKALNFAAALTGFEGEPSSKFALVRGTRDIHIAGTRTLNRDEISSLAAVDVRAITNVQTNFEAVYLEILTVAARLGWPEPPSTLPEAERYLADQLQTLTCTQRIIEKCEGKAVRLESLMAEAFWDCGDSLDEDLKRNGTAAIVALASIAKSKGRNLLPARMHLFFRGLPGLYACCSQSCSARRGRSLKSPLGRMYAEPRLSCRCSDKARIFEVISHRDCGATFLRGYVHHAHDEFIWNEPGAGARRIFSQNDGYESSRLIPIELLVDGDPHEDAIANSSVRAAWLDTRTGRRSNADRSGDLGFRKVWIPRVDQPEARGIRFKPCPVCLRDWREGGGTEGLGVSKIEAHATLGENPFTALTAAQLKTQPANLSAFASQSPERYPNQGRKVLVFSDGRQKAARLARDMPRMIQRDAFRQVLAMAVRDLALIDREATPNQVLYTAVLKIISESDSFSFRDSSGSAVADDARRYKREFAKDELSDALAEGAFNPASEEYRLALLEQIGGRYYSLTDATVGWIEPARRPLRRLLPELAAIRAELNDQEDALSLAYSWLGAAVDGYAIDENIPPNVRARAAGFGENRSDWSCSGKFRSSFRKRLIGQFGWIDQEITAVEVLFAEAFIHGGDRPFLNPASLKIRIDLGSSWFKCPRCFILEPLAFKSLRCVHCGSPGVVALQPMTDEYMRARKGYWREPVAAALAGRSKPTTFKVAEHTAQLGHREANRMHSTTERYELRFQDILIDKTDTPVDVLSCTTTMEVGVDIGSLVAVGLRNIPPERSNYQQRAGRAGRRGTGVSTVVTYGDRGPHGSYYFSRPAEIIAGPVRDPEVQVNNQKLARRHVNAMLVQSYFASCSRAIDNDASIETSLGSTYGFFLGSNDPTLVGFNKWVNTNILSSSATLSSQMASWLPSGIDAESNGEGGAGSVEWMKAVASNLLANLKTLGESLPAEDSAVVEEDIESEVENDELLRDVQNSTAPFLLQFLFDANLLPTYSFPTDLASFLVDRSRSHGSYTRVDVKEMPQQAMSKAISEYAPGRLIVIDAATYRSGGVTARTSFTEVDRARPLFQKLINLVSCDDCGHLRVAENASEAILLAQNSCAVCGASLAVRHMIQPEVYTPQGRDELPDDDREQELTFATSAQFPLPTDGDTRLESRLRKCGVHLHFTYASDQRLVAINKGLSQGLRANEGFYVCEKCGTAGLEPVTSRRHPRTYQIQGPSARNARDCDGAFRNVVLGHQFTSDVLLLRIDVEAPLGIRLTSSLDGRVMEDALASAGESILLAASDILDVDAQEFGVGYRIVPRPVFEDRDSGWRLDIYLYDTSAGGAGYSSMAAERIQRVLEVALLRLETCDCQRACTKCLQHFRNQHVQGRLDRGLGAALLRWAIAGDIPLPLTVDQQLERSIALRRSLELENISLEVVAGSLLALSQATKRKVEVRILPALLGRSNEPADLCALNDYIVSRDLPFAHRSVLDKLGIPK